MPVIFVTGTDTGIGKTYATGIIAKYLLDRKKTVITQKIIETGSENNSGDILTHREIMGTGPLDEDRSGLTCPYVFKYPASPHLSAALENIRIKKKRLRETTEILAAAYEYVVVEGVGGVHVPIDGEYTILDYLEEFRYPVILVTSARLGSINHTLLTLEALSSRSIALKGMIYNTFPGESCEIENDSREVFRIFLKKYGYNAPLADMPPFIPGLNREINLSGMFPPD